MEIYVVFVEAESEENVGAIARVMKNFGIYDLILVNPRCNPFSEKAYIVAKHAKDVLDNAKVLEDIWEALSLVDIAVGTTGISSKDKSEVLRSPLTPEEFCKELPKYKGKVGLFFGRESIGFTNEELKLFDCLITIPANPVYPVLNVSHAVAVILYEIFKNFKKIEFREKQKLISFHEKTLLKKFIKSVLKELKIKEYKKPIFERTLYNLIGKALITKREFFVMAGFFRKIKDQLK